MAIPNKLRRLKEFHGRLFNDDETADMYKERMTKKLDSNLWNISVTNVNIDGKSQILVYMHQEDDQ